MNTVEEVKTKGRDMELAGVNFLDRKGRRAHEWRRTATVKLTFIDGAVLEIPAKKFYQLDTFQFKLRPSRNDA